MGSIKVLLLLFSKIANVFLTIQLLRKSVQNMKNASSFYYFKHELQPSIAYTFFIT